MDGLLVVDTILAVEIQSSVVSAMDQLAMIHQLMPPVAVLQGQLLVVSMNNNWISITKLNRYIR